MNRKQRENRVMTAAEAMRATARQLLKKADELIEAVRKAQPDV